MKIEFEEKLYKLVTENKIQLQKDENLFYLAEDRIGPQDVTSNSETESIGDRGEFALSYLYHHKQSPIYENLVCDESETLAQNVDYWLSHIFQVQIELSTELANEKN